MADPIIEMSAVHKRFGDVHALAGLDLSVAPGELVGLLGPNGAGKTTTINILSTLLPPDEGTARVAGLDVVADAARVRGVIGLTGQFAAVDDVLTARENLVLFGRLLKLGRRRAEARAGELLERFDLVEAADRRVGGFSGGMRRRLDLAASMLGEPAVLFLDEPTTGLDPRSRQALWGVVRGLKDQGVTILLTTQYLEEADQLADRIVVVDHGRVVADGPAHELKARVGGAVLELDGGHDGPERQAEVVAALHAAGVTLDDISIRRPTLDDVFLALTGTADR